MARFSSLCKSALTSGGKRNIETLTGSDLPADHFSSFLTHWRSILYVVSSCICEAKLISLV